MGLTKENIVGIINLTQTFALKFTQKITMMRTALFVALMALLRM